MVLDDNARFPRWAAPLVLGLATAPLVYAAGVRKPEASAVVVRAGAAATNARPGAWVIFQGNAAAARPGTPFTFAAMTPGSRPVGMSVERVLEQNVTVGAALRVAGLTGSEDVPFEGGVTVVSASIHDDGVAPSGPRVLGRASFPPTVYAASAIVIEPLRRWATGRGPR